MFTRVFSLFFVAFLSPFLLIADESVPIVNRLHQEVIGTKENDPARNKRFAEILERQGLREDALVYYRKAVELAPESVSCHIALAQALKSSGKIDDAISEYEKIIRLAPDNERYTEALINLLESVEKIEDAESFYWTQLEESQDTLSRLGLICRLTDFAVRHQRTDHLLNKIHSQTCFPSSSEKALLLSQVYLRLGRSQEADKTLEEELSDELARGETPTSLLLDRLINTARQEENLEKVQEYNQIRYQIYPTQENRHELEIVENQLLNSPKQKYEYYSSHPEDFLNSLPELLLDPQTRSETALFAVSFLPKISPELLSSSTEGIALLFSNILFPQPEKWKEAVNLWHNLWKQVQTIPESDSAQESLLMALIGVPPQLGKNFVSELTERFVANPDSALFWDGFWSSQGWESLCKTLLQSEPDTLMILNGLKNDEFTPSARPMVKRAEIAVYLCRNEFAKAWNEIQTSRIFDTPQSETLSSDWTIFREMEKDPQPFHQEELARLYRDRLSLVAESPEEKFVLFRYRKAAFASQNADMIHEAAAPLLEKLEYDFKLAEQIDDTGNVRIAGLEPDRETYFNIYEILNSLLDTAIELQSLGLSKEITAAYYRYGKGKKWWTDLDGQGVFYFYELKKIIEDAE